MVLLGRHGSRISPADIMNQIHLFALTFITLAAVSAVAPGGLTTENPVHIGHWVTYVTRPEISNWVSVVGMPQAWNLLRETVVTPIEASARSLYNRQERGSVGAMMKRHPFPAKPEFKNMNK